MLTEIQVSDREIDNLRSLAAAARRDDEDSPLAAAVTDLLTRVNDDPNTHKEYGFSVQLVGIARAHGRTKIEAARKLSEFTDVDAHVPYDGVTVTQLTLVPENAVLVDIDGSPLDQHRR